MIRRATASSSLLRSLSLERVRERGYGRSRKGRPVPLLRYSAEAVSETRLIHSLCSDKGSELSLLSGIRKAMKDVLKPVRLLRSTRCACRGF
jgi:hypothetical protein